MKLLGVAVGAAVVIGSAALACVKGAATAEKGSNYVVGEDGKLMGAAPNADIRLQWQRDGFPN